MSRPEANFHEDLRRAEPVRGSSDRSFGIVIAAALLLYGLAPLRSGGSLRLPALGIAAFFLAAALIRPDILHPLNRLWTQLGLLLGKIVNPIVTAILFFGIFAPIGLIWRMLGKDPLRLKPSPGDSSYWIERQPPGPSGDTMVRQF